MNEFQNRIAVEDAFSQIERSWGAPELLVTCAGLVMTADEVADSILFLLSARSRPMNGQNLHVDGV